MSPPTHTTPSEMTRRASPSLSPLLGVRAVDRFLGLLVGVAALAVGLWLGFDLRLLPPLRAADRLFLLGMMLMAPLPIAALSALYHEPLHRTLLPWPVSARAHFALGLRLLVTRHLAWGAVALGAGLGAAWGRALPASLALVAFPPLLLLGAALLSLGAAGLSAAMADAEGGSLARLRAHLAGPFASPRHAPFFYLPALAYALAAGSGMVALAGAAILAQGRHGGASPWPYVWIASPPLLGIVTIFFGRLAYGRHGLRTIARVHEEARTIYGGRPAPEDPPYGASLGRLLPRRLRPYFDKELREQSRAFRGLWAFIALMILVSVVYAVNVGAPLAVAPFVASLFVIFIATSPLRRAPRISGGELLITLPWRWHPAFGGRWLALLWPLGHLLGGTALALGWRHGVSQTIDLLFLASSTSAASIAATRVRGRAGRRGDRWRRSRWGIGAQVIPAVAMAGALLVQSWRLLGLALYGALGAYTLIVFLGGRR